MDGQPLEQLSNGDPRKQRRRKLRIGYNGSGIGGHTNTHPNESHSRRDFLTSLFAGVLGAGILQVARRPSTWAAALSSAAMPGHFEIQKVAEDVYFALAQPWALPNSNAVIFVKSADA